MKTLRLLRWGLTLMLAFLCSANRAPAQEVTATITGTVVDQSGASITGAAVTARDTARGVVLSTVTNGDGAFVIPRLPVGTYDLKVESQGFQTEIQAGITLVLNQTARLEFKLKVGQISQVVEATATAPMLQTDTTAVSTIIDAKTNDNLPLATRNPVQLTLLAPGAVTVDAASFNLGSNTAEGGGRPYINGNREQANNFLLDGIDNNQVSENRLGLTPSPDAIEEFNLITQNASAEFGNFQGGIVNTSIKSGTNGYHGDVYEFFRNDVMNANQWENKINPNPALQFSTPKVRWNMFGGTFGGPIVKNKLFFFADYQGGRFDFPSSVNCNGGGSGTCTVLSAAERQGNFSAICLTGFTAGVCNDRGTDKNGNPTIIHQLYDPCTAGTGVASGPACVLAAVSTPFAGNIIPSNRLNPVFTKFVNSPLYPAAAANLPNGYAAAVDTYGQQRNSDQVDVKFDYDQSDKDRFFARYSQGNQNDPATNSIALFGNTTNFAHLYNSAFNWNHSFTPTLMNELRVGLNKIYFSSGATSFSPAVGELGNSLGITNGNPAGVVGLPDIGLDGGTITNIQSGTLTNLGNALVVEAFQSTVAQLDDGLIWTHGRHTTKFGLQGNRYRIDVFYTGNGGELGAILYNGQYTAGAAKTAGDPGADFALGLPSYVGRGVTSGGWQQKDWLFAGYVQDDWRVTRNLTLNLGLRYEARTPWVEAHNHQDNVNLQTGAIEIAAVNGNSRGLYNSVYGWPDFQPRLGFAWTPDMLGGKTVVRGAFTQSSYLEGTGTNLRLTQNPPFTPPQTEGPNSTTPGATPFSTQAGPTAAATPVAGNPYAGTTMLAWDRTVQPAIAYQWNLSVQREIARDMTLQVGYIGQHAIHLMVPTWVTQAELTPAGTSSCQPKVGPAVPCAYPYVGGQNPAGGFGPQQIGNVKDTASSGGMRYNALQVVLQKRYSHGLETQVSYSFAKCMTNNSGYFGTWSGTTQTTPASPYFQNLYNPAGEWSQCYYDSKHVISAYALYELPIGKGKAFGKDLPTAVNTIVGGWSVNPIVSWHTGFPFALYAADASGTNSQGARPNCNGAPQYIKTGTALGFQWVSPSGFSQPTSGFGSCPAQGPVIGPGFANVDLSLQKNFLLSETRKIQFRAEFLNLFNHPQFAKMDNTVGDANFGLITTTQPAREIQLAVKFYF
jgi:Carboxypeptidase regulatory-like domain